MSTSYLEGLEPGSTVKGVFDGVYGRADAVVKELDSLRDTKYTPNSRIIPGLPVEMTWSGSRDSHTTHVLTRHGVNTRMLLSLTRSFSGAEDSTLPYGISAFRDREISADYRLTDDNTSMAIECKLGGFGIRGAARQYEEPIGSHRLQYGTAIESLTHREKWRLGLVAQSIVDSVTAVELIMAGEDIVDVFEVLGRAIPARH